MTATPADPRESITLAETAEVLDPREVVGEGSPAPAEQPAVTELAEIVSIMSEEQQRRVAALREAKALLGTQGNYGALRAGAGELSALSSYILTGEATWADGDDDEDPEPG
jgi:hypothetical protein